MELAPILDFIYLIQALHAAFFHHPDAGRIIFKGSRHHFPESPVQQPVNGAQKRFRAVSLVMVLGQNGIAQFDTFSGDLCFIEDSDALPIQADRRHIAIYRLR